MPDHRARYTQDLSAVIRLLLADATQRSMAIISHEEFFDPEKLSAHVEWLLYNLVNFENLVPPNQRIRFAALHPHDEVWRFLNDDRYVLELAGLTTADAAQQEEFLKDFPRGRRLRFAVYNIPDPVEGMARAVVGEINHPWLNFSWNAKTIAVCRRYLERA